MVSIGNAEYVEEAIKELKLDRVREKMPTETSDKIVLTYPIKRDNIMRTLVSVNRTTTATSAVIATASSSRRTFIKGIMFQNYSSAAADNTLMQVFITLAATGAVINLAYLSKPTLTLFDKAIYINFDIPIEVQRGSAYGFTNTFTVGTSNSSIQIFGYETDL